MGAVGFDGRGLAWTQRKPIGADDRMAFDAVYRRHEEAERQLRGLQEGVRLQRHQQASVDRVVTIPMPPGSAYYLVGGRNAVCGVGPLR